MTRVESAEEAQLQPDPRSESRARRALATGAVTLPIGLGLVGIGPSDVGMVVTLAALLVLLYGVHSFGRLGPG